MSAVARAHRRDGAALLLCGFCWAIGGLPAPVLADTSGGETVTESAVTAPVVIDGDVLFRVRGVSAFPAEQRAESIAGRIRDLAEDPDFDPRSLRVVPEQGHSVIYAGNRPVMHVFDADAAVEDVKRDVLADVIVTRITLAVTQYREYRSSRNLLVSVAYTLVATGVLVGLLWGIGWTSRRGAILLERRLERRMHSLEAKSSRILRAQQIFTVLHGLLRGLRILTVLVLVYAYLNSVLGLFPWTRAAAANLFNYVLDPLKILGGGVIGYLPHLFFLVVLFVITRYALKLLHMAFDALRNGTLHWVGFEPEWAIPTYRVVRLLVLAFALVIAYPYIPGSDSAAFKGVSLFLGVLVSLGSSSVVSNIIAGYTMMYRRAFRVGDVIRIGETVGQAVEIRMLVTHLRTFKNEEVVLPNSTILTSEIINYSSLARSHGLLLHTTVGIGYEVPWRQVEAMLLLAAERTPGLLREPKPFVLHQSLGDFAVNYELNVYCDEASRMPRFYTELHRRILDVFNEYGVQIMTPNYESDPAEPKLVPPGEWYAAPAAPEPEAKS